MDFIIPPSEELTYLRPDPLLWEQELDCLPEVAEAVEKAVGFRAGKVFWRTRHDHLMALELADLGRGRPSMAMVYGYWDRYEPRPPEHEIHQDLLDFSLWIAEISPDVDPKIVDRLARIRDYSGLLTWPEGSVLRTPDDAFTDLPDFPYEPQYIEIEGLRMAYIEHGTGDPVLMLHGEPTWGYLYRKMIPPLAKTGRTVVPDLIGFGRSDKPVAENAYSYRAHVRWMRGFIETLDLTHITLICQDWGGLIGIRVLSQMPERFSRLVAMNTSLPTGDGMGEAFGSWRSMSQRVREFDMIQLMRMASPGLRDAPEEAVAPYGMPFPSGAYQAGARVFPRLVPVRPDHPGAYDNRIAVENLRTLDLPVMLVQAEGDAVTRGSDAFLQSIFPNAESPIGIKNAGHFLQEDAGEDIAHRICDWMGVGIVD